MRHGFSKTVSGGSSKRCKRLSPPVHALEESKEDKSVAFF